MSREFEILWRLYESLILKSFFKIEDEAEKIQDLLHDHKLVSDCKNFDIQRENYLQINVAELLKKMGQPGLEPGTGGL